MESQDDAESDGGGGGNGRDPCDKKGVQERAAKHYAGWHDCIEMLEREIERKRENDEEEGGEGGRKEERKRKSSRMKRERENGGSHAGRMTGLLRRGEESGGYDRRRVQIITIIIFPGNMAAERGWPPGSLAVRVGGKREEERVGDRRGARGRRSETEDGRVGGREGGREAARQGGLS